MDGTNNSISAPSKTAKNNITDTNEAEHSGHPNLVIVPENIKKLYKIILANGKLKFCDVAEERGRGWPSGLIDLPKVYEFDFW